MDSLIYAALLLALQGGQGETTLSEGREWRELTHGRDGAIQFLMPDPEGVWYGGLPSLGLRAAHRSGAEAWVVVEPGGGGSEFWLGLKRAF